MWKRKGQIVPRYAKINKLTLNITEKVIETYKKNVGHQKKRIKELLNLLEFHGFDYRFIRGLSILIDRKASFKLATKIEPTKLRRNLFMVSARLGLATTIEKREKILKIISKENHIHPNEVDKNLYADLDSELILEQIDHVNPVLLLKAYNLSLTQSLLFNATDFTFSASSNWQKIFYTIKRLGLIYEVFQNGGFSIRVTGPIHLFKLTRRYGTSIAKLLPVIINQPNWQLQANILWKYSNEIFKFELDSTKHQALFPKQIVTDPPFDSSIEQEFFTRFNALNSKWELKREPELLKVGRFVMIPDFTFERNGIKLYFEIAGFWTKEYIDRKVSKLRKVKVNMLVAINNAQACDKTEKLKQYPNLKLIYYRNKIPLSPIYTYLEEIFDKVKANQVAILKKADISFTESVIEYSKVAKRCNVTVEAVREALRENPPKGYKTLANSLINKKKSRHIKELLKTVKDPLTLTITREILEREGVKDVTSFLQTVGYKIKWNGIDPERATIIRQ